jgi:uncharacterized protein involved in response to NO
MTGFILTAIPNWTGRLPLQGKPLLVLFALWLVGRAAMLATDEIGTGAGAIVDCTYLVALTAVISREIVAGSNWRNLRVAVLIGLTAVANIVFQAEVLIYAAPTYGLRLAVAAIVGLIMVVGGRITPSFTSNWMTRQGSEIRPAPLSRFDIGSIALAAVGAHCLDRRAGLVWHRGIASSHGNRAGGTALALGGRANLARADPIYPACRLCFRTARSQYCGPKSCRQAAPCTPGQPGRWG